MTQDIRELLELAALACGYVVQEHINAGAWVYNKDSPPDKFGEPRIFTWMPGTDDGDGARMEEKLGIDVQWAQDSGFVLSAEFSRKREYCAEFFDRHNGNRQAARKMASLRVAAHIGERMRCK